jgi:hypothetical protein
MSGTATVTVAYQGTKHTPTSPACHGRPPRRGGRDRLHAAPRVVMEDRDAEPRRRRAPPLRSLPLRLLRLRRCPEPPELHQHCTPLPSPPLSRIPVCSAPTTGSLSRALQDGDLGTVSLGILYTSFTLFSVVASPVVTRLGSERALVLGTSGYLLFILANLVPAWCVSLGCSSVSVSQNARENTDDVPRRAG